MLDYAQEDAKRMQFGISMARVYLLPAQQDVRERLEEVYSFLDGLLAEGYFG